MHVIYSRQRNYIIYNVGYICVCNIRYLIICITERVNFPNLITYCFLMRYHIIERVDRRIHIQEVK